MNIFIQPWPWYIAGPLIGLIIPLLLLTDNKTFGVSQSFRHILASLSPRDSKHFNYAWKQEVWNLFFVAGIAIGGFIAWNFLSSPFTLNTNEIASSAVDPNGNSDLLPKDIFSFSSLLTLRGFTLMILGGFLIGFGSRYAGGCTSGHSIMGLSNLQFASLVATLCFFAGGVFMTWIILPYILAI